MQDRVKQAIQTSLKKVIQAEEAPASILNHIQLEYSRDPQHGDFACNIAMMLAKVLKQSPQAIAKAIVDSMPRDEMIKQVEVAGPGFINIHLSDEAYQALLGSILEKKENFGRSQHGQGQTIHMEIVSANPTGPLHVGHGRLAAFDASLSNILKAIGYEVHNEYYVNDAGRQMQILGLSVWLRYLECLGEVFEFPEGAYEGDYIIDIARVLVLEENETFKASAASLFKDLPDCESQDQRVDALIIRAKEILGEVAFERVRQSGLDHVLSDIQADLATFGVSIDHWFKESQLVGSGQITHCLNRLKKAGHLYEKEGALWLKTTPFGDDKDRVVMRNNGHYTYFAADIANHLYKFERGYDRILNTFGSDHHGYTKRLEAAVSALGCDSERVKCLLIQFAILYRGQQKIAMSTRKGQFVTLKALYEEVGLDAARFFYVMRRYDQHLDFDLELAKSRSNENPVYYIQYAHARVCSVLRQREEKQLDWDEARGLEHLKQLKTPQEKALIRVLSRYQETLIASGEKYEPQILATYLQELANCFHSYYNAYQFLVEDLDLRCARLNLVMATRYVIASGLKLLGVSAPESM